MEGHCGLGCPCHICGHTGEDSLISLPGWRQGEGGAIGGDAVGGRGGIGYGVHASLPGDGGGGASTPRALQVGSVALGNGDKELQSLYCW